MSVSTFGKPSSSSPPSRPARLPVLEGLRPFERSSLGGDILGGITLAALGIPEVMGYTKIIGTPVITGMYTLLLPVLVFALFGSSRHLVVAADSATAAIVGAGLLALSGPPTLASPRFVALTGLVALLAGGMLLLARLLRLGFLADFLSRTVLVGFLSGVGIQVAIGQLHGMFGLERGPHDFLGQIAHLASHANAISGMEVTIALIVLLVIIGFEVLLPRFPGALLAVAGMIIASAMLHWQTRGIRLVGDVPGGLPRLALPDVSPSDIVPLLSISFSCFIVILAQSAATSRAYALRHRDSFSENTDLVGLALANFAAGLSGSFVVNGSPTKTAIVDTAGGRSQFAHLVTCAVTALPDPPPTSSEAATWISTRPPGPTNSGSPPTPLSLPPTCA